MQREAERTSKELATTSEYLAGVMAELAVAQVCWGGGGGGVPTPASPSACFVAKRSGPA